MKYYAYYGHRDFILCLGYKADKIKESASLPNSLKVLITLIP